MIRQTAIVLAAVASLAAATAANANAPSLGDGFRNFGNAFAKQRTAIDTLKRGQRAQNSRMALRMQTRPGRQAGRAIEAVQDTLRHRGDVARHARMKTKVTRTLQTTGRKTVTFAKQVGVKTYTVDRPMTSTRDRFATRTKGAGNMTRKQAQALNNTRRMHKRGKVAQVARRTAKAANVTRTTRAAKSARAVKTVRVVGHARNVKHTAKTAKRSYKVAKTARTMKNLKALSGGAGLAVAEGVLGADIPDPFEAAAWTVNTLKDPRNAPKAIAKLGKDAVKTVADIGKTITNPKKLAENTVKTAKAVGKVAGDVGKGIGFAIKHPDRAVKIAAKDVGKAAVTVGCAIIKLFGGCR